jgi:ubiquinone/menaquinone biosynthesis C-methylase UbiE
VVDLGCGNGGLALLLAELGRMPVRYIGLDLLEERIAAGRAAVPWGEFVVGSADWLPVPDGTADVVVMATLLSSLREPFLQEAVATEVARVLRPGGRLVVYDIRYPSPRNRSVVPITASRLERLFPGWPIDTRTITLLPPIARSALGAGLRRYRWLASIPWLRSYMAAVLTRP